MVQSVFIINEEGETLERIDVGDFETDEVLFGGFMSAIQTFSDKLSGDAVQELSLGNSRMVIQKVNDYILVTVFGKGAKDPVTVSKRVSEVFKENISGGITNEMLEKLRTAATSAVTSSDRASDWASKMF
ncbi:MAG: hypothetical protein KAQ65_04870 [Candidatus Thorarchaeota archaeon]|nr:hypothetical protein [Candidatus Thorarchaeota archaeon]